MIFCAKSYITKNIAFSQSTSTHPSECFTSLLYIFVLKCLCVRVPMAEACPPPLRPPRGFCQKFATSDRSRGGGGEGDAVEKLVVSPPAIGFLSAILSLFRYMSSLSLSFFPINQYLVFLFLYMHHISHYIHI
jgi:hypothetical protein